MDGGGKERRRRKKGGIKIYSESIIKVDEVYAKKCAGGNYQQMSVIRNSGTPPTCAMCVQCLYDRFFKYCCFMHTHTDLFLSFNFCRQKKRKRKKDVKRKTGRKKDDLQPPTSVCKALYLSSTPAN